MRQSREVDQMTSETPLYVQVADQLEEEIATLGTGEPLPSEHELARDHEINRLTARAALEELERRYLVRRHQGRRTVVARRIDYRLDAQGVPGWTKTVEKCGGTPRTEVDRLKLRQPPPGVRRALALHSKKPALYLGRRRFVDGDIAAYAESWFDPSLVPKLEDRLSQTGTLKLALGSYKLKTKRGLLRCELAIAPPGIAECLESPDRPLVFVLTTHLHVKRHTMAITTSWLRADIFNVVFEMGKAGV